MARKIQRLGDSNDGYGIIFNIPQSKVFADDLLIAVNGSMGSEHEPFHGDHLEDAWQTISSQSKVFIDGLPVIGEGDTDTCNHIREGGSHKVLIG